jgi:hypothetical protein
MAMLQFLKSNLTMMAAALLLSFQSSRVNQWLKHLFFTEIPKLPLEELLPLEPEIEMEQEPLQQVVEPKLGIYKHSKTGNLYSLYEIIYDSETYPDRRCSYQALYGERKKFGRPMRMWLEEVEVDGVLVPRFQYQMTWTDYVMHAAMKNLPLPSLPPPAR